MIAFIFPGQGSQAVGMGRALADAFPICRETFEEADTALREDVGSGLPAFAREDAGELRRGHAVAAAQGAGSGGGQAGTISRLCFEGPADELTLTENTQPAILTVSVAAWRLLASRGLAPSFAAGHSLGEYSAHVAAGTFAFADAVRIVRRRGRYMQEAVPVGTGAMAAVLGLDAERVAQACAEAARGEVVSPANLNGPGQVVIAGTRDGVARAGERARELGAKRVLPLPVSAPFHCALMMPAEEKLAPELRALTAKDPRVPVVANVDAEPKHDAAAAIEALVRQVSRPVRWEESVRRLAAAGVRAYVEIGPGTVLSGLVRKIHREATVVNLETPDSLAAVETLFRRV